MGPRMREDMEVGVRGIATARDSSARLRCAALGMTFVAKKMGYRLRGNNGGRAPTRDAPTGEGKMRKRWCWG